MVDVLMVSMHIKQEQKYTGGRGNWLIVAYGPNPYPALGFLSQDTNGLIAAYEPNPCSLSGFLSLQDTCHAHNVRVLLALPFHGV